MMRMVLMVIFIQSIAASAFADGSTRYLKDLDNDGKPETVTVDVTYYAVDPAEETIRIPKETRIDIFAEDGKQLATSTVPNGHPKIEFVSLMRDHRWQIVIWTLGGAHYTSLNIFDYRNGSLDPLFSNGSACDVKADFDSKRPSINVGRANLAEPKWDYSKSTPLWNVYRWNGKKFVFDAKKSTTREVSEDESISGYTHEIIKQTILPNKRY